MGRKALLGGLRGHSGQSGQEHTAATTGAASAPAAVGGIDFFLKYSLFDILNKDKQGNPTLIDAEFYTFTGSKILIDQATNDFTKEDLPSPTVIQQIKGKTGQTFFKFT